MKLFQIDSTTGGIAVSCHRLGVGVKNKLLGAFF